jgi:hypothetical protein
VNSVECNLNANNIDFEDGMIRIGSEFDIAEKKNSLRVYQTPILESIQEILQKRKTLEQAVYNIICILFSD